MRKNLVSVGSITDTGLIVKFFDHHFWILDKFNQTHAVASGVRDPSNGLYRFNESFEGNSLEYKDRVTLWHKRYGYLSYFGLDHLSKYNKVSGFPKIDPHHKICESCLAGRQHRERFLRKSDNRATMAGQKIHSDLVGPLQQPSLAGSR
jgi:hypothetical protein